MLKRSFFIFVVGALIGMGSVSARAATVLELSGFHFAGTVQSVAPDAVTVAAPEGVVPVPLDLKPTFRVGRRKTPVEALLPGASVDVHYDALHGTVLSVSGTLAQFQVEHRATPIILPVSYLHHSRAYVQLKSGRIERVPVDQAVEMEVAQGAVILGSSMADVPEYYNHGPGWGMQWDWGWGWYHPWPPFYYRPWPYFRR